MEWEWNRAWDGMGMESLGMEWEWNGKVVSLVWTRPHLSPLSKGRCDRLVPAVAVGGDRTIARSGLCRARASSPARSSAIPPEIALVERKKARSNKQQDGVLEEERLVRRSKPLAEQPPATAHTTAVTSRHREPLALGRAGPRLMGRDPGLGFPLERRCSGCVVGWRPLRPGHPRPRHLRVVRRAHLLLASPAQVASTPSTRCTWQHLVWRLAARLWQDPWDRLRVPGNCHRPRTRTNAHTGKELAHLQQLSGVPTPPPSHTFGQNCRAAPVRLARVAGAGHRPAGTQSTVSAIVEMPRPRPRLRGVSGAEDGNKGGVVGEPGGARRGGVEPVAGVAGAKVQRVRVEQ